MADAELAQPRRRRRSLRRHLQPGTDHLGDRGDLALHHVAVVGLSRASGAASSSPASPARSRRATAPPRLCGGAGATSRWPRSQPPPSRPPVGRRRSSSSPRARPAASPPQKLSPAPVTSTTSTSGAAMLEHRPIRRAQDRALRAALHDDGRHALVQQLSARSLRVVVADDRDQLLTAGQEHVDLARQGEELGPPRRPGFVRVERHDRPAARSDVLDDAGGGRERHGRDVDDRGTLPAWRSTRPAGPRGGEPPRGSAPEASCTPSSCARLLRTPPSCGPLGRRSGAVPGCRSPHRAAGRAPPPGSRRRPGPPLRPIPPRSGRQWRHGGCCPLAKPSWSRRWRARCRRWSCCRRRRRQGRGAPRPPACPAWPAPVSLMPGPTHGR